MTARLLLFDLIENVGVALCMFLFQGGRVVTSGVALLRRATFSPFRTTKFFYDVAFSLELGAFFGMPKKSILWKEKAFVFLS